MKKFMIIAAVAGFGMMPLTARAEERDSTGMPGDNFDLQGAMELFRTSKNLEAFEKALNTEKNAVNNLDLNGDKKIDYISVYDKAEGTNHAIIMRVAVNDKESQDVAVIAIQKQGDDKAQLQIIGDKDVYGEEVIMEPYNEEAQKTNGPSAVLSGMQPAIVFVNVWGWPCVNYMYEPYYSYYNSPWYWGYYPNYWDPWAPYYYYDYYPRVHHYHYMYYHTAHACYVPAAQNVYYQHRTNSTTVNRRYADARQNYISTGGRRSNSAQPGQNAGRQPSVQPASPSRREPGTTISPDRQPVGPTRTQPAIESRPVSPGARPASPTRTEPAVTPNSPQPGVQPSSPQRTEPVARPAQPVRTEPAARPQQSRPQPAARPVQQQRQAPAARPMPSSRPSSPMRSAPSAPVRRGR